MVEFLPRRIPSIPRSLNFNKAVLMFHYGEEESILVCHNNDKVLKMRQINCLHSRVLVMAMISMFTAIRTNRRGHGGGRDQVICRGALYWSGCVDGKCQVTLRRRL